MTRVAIAGVSGRMGKHIAAAVLEHSQVSLAAASVHGESPALGLDVGTVCGLDPQNLATVADLGAYRLDLLVDDV
ncbi:MAG: hypothetical protein WD601_04185, partial [Pseudohongiellaceae bacterium]